LRSSCMATCYQTHGESPGSPGRRGLALCGREGPMEGRVIVVGAGGLGCAVLPLLARLGRPIRVYDDDRVSLDNLQRQLLFRTTDVSRPKVEVAAERLRQLVPGVEIEGRDERLDPANLPAALAEAALVVDGSDNFPTRFLVNDACVLAGVPLVHGGI